MPDNLPKFNGYGKLCATAIVSVAVTLGAQRGCDYFDDAKTALEETKFITPASAATMHSAIKEDYQREINITRNIENTHYGEVKETLGKIERNVDRLLNRALRNDP